MDFPLSFSPGKEMGKHIKQRKLLPPRRKSTPRPPPIPQHETETMPALKQQQKLFFLVPLLTTAWFK